MGYNNKGQPKYLEKNLSQNHSIRHKSHTEGPDIKPSPSPSTNRLNHSKTNVLSGMQKMLRANLNKLFYKGVNIRYMGFRGNVSKFRNAKRQITFVFLNIFFHLFCWTCQTLILHKPYN
jgi:hypothetical protein